MIKLTVKLRLGGGVHLKSHIKLPVRWTSNNTRRAISGSIYPHLGRCKFDPKQERQTNRRKFKQTNTRVCLCYTELDNWCLCTTIDPFELFRLRRFVCVVILVCFNVLPCLCTTFALHHTASVLWLKQILLQFQLLRSRYVFLPQKNNLSLLYLFKSLIK